MRPYRFYLLRAKAPHGANAFHLLFLKVIYKIVKPCSCSLDKFLDVKRVALSELYSFL